jgi:O-antigen/teichoic acid export membrane protein
LKPSPVSRPVSIRKSIGWLITGQIAYFVLQFGSSVTIARLLNPYEVGIFALAFATVGMISIIQAIGLNNYLIREPDLTSEISAAVFSINLIIAIILSLVIGGLGILGGALFNEVGVRHVLSWLAWIPIIQAVGFLPTTLIERDGNFKLISLIKTVGNVIGTISTVLFALYGFSYMSFAYGQLITATVCAGLAATFGAHHNQFNISFARWREIRKFALHMLATSGVSRIGNRLQELIMGKLLGLGNLGLYSRANNVYSMLWDNVFVVISRVVFVDLANLARSGSSFGPRYKQSLSLITAIIWPAFAGLGVLSGPFIFWIYGEKWISVTTPLTLLCMVGILYTSVAMTWELFVIAGETGRQARIEIVRTTVGLILFAAACTISLSAAAVARVLEAGFTVAIYTPHVLRITTLRHRELARIYFHSGLLALAATAPSICVMTSFGWSPATPIVMLLGGIFLGLVLWIITMWRLNHILFHEISKIMVSSPLGKHLRKKPESGF